MTDAGSTARLFVALELPASVSRAAAAWGEPILAAGRGRLRPVDPDGLHVTLCFLGSHAADEIEAIADTCSDVLAAAAPARTGLRRGAWLPRRRPRVLTIELADPDAMLSRLQGRLAGALGSGGWYRAEHRAYLPHVTLARVRGALESPIDLPEVAPVAFVADRVALMRSRLGRGPARYERVAQWTIR